MAMTMYPDSRDGLDREVAPVQARRAIDLWSCLSQLLITNSSPQTPYRRTINDGQRLSASRASAQVNAAPIDSRYIRTCWAL